MGGLIDQNMLIDIWRDRLTNRQMDRLIDGQTDRWID